MGLCLSLAAEFQATIMQPSPAPGREIQVKWHPPDAGWCKLNTDGSARGCPGISGAGGVVRDSDGKWLRGFSRYLGQTNSFTAEVWGLRDGLRMALSLNISALVVECDAKAVLDLVWGQEPQNDKLMPLIVDCRELSKCFHRFSMTHTYREGNQVADVLARLGGNMKVSEAVQDQEVSSFNNGCTFELDSETILYYDSPPGNVLLALLGDRVGVTTPRFVRTVLADYVGD